MNTPRLYHVMKSLAPYTSPSKTSEANVVRGKDSQNQELPELLLEVAHREETFFRQLPLLFPSLHGML